MMKPEEISAELSTNYRVVDLSLDVHPGVQKVDGTYHWGNQIRKFQIRQFIAPGPHFMYWLEAESHVGTHVEMPAHIIDGRKASGDMPLDCFFGNGIVLKFDSLPLKDGQRPITSEHLKNVRAGDIVLFWSPFEGRGTPYISMDAAEYLAKLPVKMIGIQGVNAPDDTHHVLLGKTDAPIPIIEQLDHLDDLKKERFFFMGLPLRVAELDSSWIRAVALEPLG